MMTAASLREQIIAELKSRERALARISYRPFAKARWMRRWRASFFSRRRAHSPPRSIEFARSSGRNLPLRMELCSNGCCFSLWI